MIDERLAKKEDLANLATKADLLATKTDLQVEIAETRARIADAKTEIIKWMFGTIGFQTLIVLGAVFVLARVVR